MSDLEVAELAREALKYRDKALNPAKYDTSYIKAEDEWRHFWAENDEVLARGVLELQAKVRKLEQENARLREVERAARNVGNGALPISGPNYVAIYAADHRALREALAPKGEG